MDEKYIENLGMVPEIDEGLWDRLKARASGGFAGFKNIAAGGSSDVQGVKFDSLFNSFRAKCMQTFADFTEVIEPYKNSGKVTASQNAEIEKIYQLAHILYYLPKKPVNEANAFTRPYSVLGAQASGNPDNIINAYKQILKKHYIEFMRDASTKLRVNPAQYLGRFGPTAAGLLQKFAEVTGAPDRSPTARFGAEMSPPVSTVPVAPTGTPDPSAATPEPPATPAVTPSTTPTTTSTAATPASTTGAPDSTSRTKIMTFLGKWKNAVSRFDADVKSLSLTPPQQHAKQLVDDLNTPLASLLLGFPPPKLATEKRGGAIFEADNSGFDSKFYALQQELTTAYNEFKLALSTMGGPTEPFAYLSQWVKDASKFKDKFFLVIGSHGGGVDRPSTAGSAPVVAPAAATAGSAPVVAPAAATAATSPTGGSALEPEDFATYKLSMEAIDKIIGELTTRDEMRSEIRTSIAREAHKADMPFPVNPVLDYNMPDGSVRRFMLRWKYVPETAGHNIDFYVEILTKNPAGKYDSQKGKTWEPFIAFVPSDIIDDEGEIKSGFDTLGVIKKTNPNLGNVIEQGLKSEGAKIDDKKNTGMAEALGNILVASQADTDRGISRLNVGTPPDRQASGMPAGTHPALTGATAKDPKNKFGAPNSEKGGASKTVVAPDPGVKDPTLTSAPPAAPAAPAAKPTAAASKKITPKSARPTKPAPTPAARPASKKPVKKPVKKSKKLDEGFRPSLKDFFPL